MVLTGAAFQCRVLGGFNTQGVTTVAALQQGVFQELRLQTTAHAVIANCVIAAAIPALVLVITIVARTAHQGRATLLDIGVYTSRIHTAAGGHGVATFTTVQIKRLARTVDRIVAQSPHQRVVARQRLGGEAVIVFTAIQIVCPLTVNQGVVT